VQTIPNASNGTSSSTAGGVYGRLVDSCGSFGSLDSFIALSF
jgi:hypothetical protein